MRFAYADPPYPGQSAKHYKDHSDYDGEVNHVKLAETLATYDGWVLHTASTTLSHVLDCLRLGHRGIPLDYRIMSWVKPFCAFKRNVSVAYSWEPVLVKPIRKPVVSGRIVMRDYISESITMKKGLTGAKPPAVCRWAFEMVGAEPDDEMDDLYPGTGIVKATWNEWCAEVAP